MTAASAGVGYLCTSVFYFLVVSAACLPYADGTLLFWCLVKEVEIFLSYLLLVLCMFKDNTSMSPLRQPHPNQVFVVALKDGFFSHCLRWNVYFFQAIVCRLSYNLQMTTLETCQWGKGLKSNLLWRSAICHSKQTAHGYTMNHCPYWHLHCAAAGSL